MRAGRADDELVLPVVQRGGHGPAQRDPARSLRGVEQPGQLRRAGPPPQCRTTRSVPTSSSPTSRETCGAQSGRARTVRPGAGAGSSAASGARPTTSDSPGPSSTEGSPAPRRHPWHRVPLSSGSGADRPGRGRGRASRRRGRPGRAAAQRAHGPVRVELPDLGGAVAPVLITGPVVERDVVDLVGVPVELGRGRRSAVVQTRTTSSWVAAASMLPSGLNARLADGRVRDSSPCSTPSGTLHSRTCRSPPEVASIVPSGANSASERRPRVACEAAGGEPRGRPGPTARSGRRTAGRPATARPG